MTAMEHNQVADKQQKQNNLNQQPQKNDNNTKAKGDDTNTDWVGLHVGKSIKSNASI